MQTFAVFPIGGLITQVLAGMGIIIGLIIFFKILGWGTQKVKKLGAHLERLGTDNEYAETSAAKQRKIMGNYAKYGKTLLLGKEEKEETENPETDTRI